MYIEETPRPTQAWYKEFCLAMLRVANSDRKFKEAQEAYLALKA